MTDYTDLIERLRFLGAGEPFRGAYMVEAADAIIALEEHVDALSAQIVADTTDKDYWKARVKLLEDALIRMYRAATDPHSSFDASQKLIEEICEGFVAGGDKP